MSALLQFERVSKSFGAHKVVSDLDLEIVKGEFLSLLGPSGSGKTTILMMLAGFEAPTSGRIWQDGRPIDHLPPHRRQMGVVFQSYALFPHMSVGENIAFPLQMRRRPKAEITEKVGRALDMVRLGGLADRRPAQLSGGQQQRVALARALVFEPGVVLMDEPLGALDKQLREHMQLELRDLHRRLGLTIVFVTHDQSEALTMSDRIAVLNAGRIEQLDSPQGIYDEPRSQFVAEFIGETNVIKGRVATQDGARAEITIAPDVRVVTAAVPGAAVGDRVLILLRPERIRVDGEMRAANGLHVTVADCVYRGDHLRVQLTVANLSLVAKCGRGAGGWREGSHAVASFDLQDCTVIRP